MTQLIKHSLRAGAASFSGYSPTGWSPRLKADLRGPTPAGAQLVWTVTRPDGSDWFEHRIDAPSLGEGEMTTVDLQRFEDGTDIDEAGTATFTLRVVSELDGVDELLHNGSLTVGALEGEHRYAADNDWFLATAYVSLDAVGDADGPRLKVTTFLKGVVDTYQVEAHLFRDGERSVQASDVSSGYGFTANNGDPIGTELVAEFDDCRGWNNLRDQSWGEDSWVVLDQADGSYEVKFLREKSIARVVAFEVSGGRIVSEGAVEADQWSGHVIIVDAAVAGEADGVHDGTAPAFYGDAATSAVWGSLDDVYALCTSLGAPASTDTSTDSSTDSSNQGDTVTLDESGQAYFDRMERLIQTWASYLENRTPPYSSDDLLQAEALIRELPGFEEKKAAASATGADTAVQLSGEDTTIGAMAARVVAMGVSAQAMLSGDAAAADDSVAPFRAVLANDKLAVVEDHSPPADYRYQTTDGKVIETPEELAEAEFWYFEGTAETDGKATVDDVEVSVTVTGWRVLGWQFDADGNTVAEWEKQGTGNDAPKSAFTPQE